MNENPYKYLGPLDPNKDKPVFVPRSKQLYQVIDGINKGDYWSILGPIQVGKTTFLRQIQAQSPDNYYIYIDLGMTHDREEMFYRRLIELIMKKIPSKQGHSMKYDWDKKNPGFSLIQFLKKFEPLDDTKKIVFLLDDGDHFLFLKTFLLLWRTIFHESYYVGGLKRYVIVITGSMNLIELTTGKTSPFNIARVTYLKDFSVAESDQLVIKPMTALGISIKERGKKKLLSQVSGHPQMLQQVCYFLVARAFESNMMISVEDVDDAMEDLLKTNASISLLKNDIEKDKNLKDLIRSILDRKKVKYHSVKEFYLSGAGAIVDKNSFCDIRNEIFKKTIIETLETVEVNQGGRLSAHRSIGMRNLIGFISLILCFIIIYFSAISNNSEGMVVSLGFAFAALVLFISTRFTTQKEKR